MTRERRAQLLFDLGGALHTLSSAAAWMRENGMGELGAEMQQAAQQSMKIAGRMIGGSPECRAIPCMHCGLTGAAHYDNAEGTCNYYRAAL